MSAVIYPADEGGCGHYRLIFPAAVLGVPNAELGEVPRIQIGWNEQFEGIEQMWHKMLDVRATPDAETLVFQRPLHCKYQQLFPLLKAKGHRIVVDIDDHFDKIERDNVAWWDVEPGWIRQEELEALMDRTGKSANELVSHVNGRKSHVKVPGYIGRGNRVHMAAALRHADLITCSTPALAEYYSRFAPAVVIRNGIPEGYLKVPETIAKNAVPVVMWTGSIMTHPRDLEDVGEALVELRREGVEFELHIVGTGIGVENQLGIKPDHVTGWCEFEDYPRLYAQADIAICPLERNTFNIGKSWLKPLEAAALGVVPVMSALPEYEELNKLGVGRIARRPRQWKSALRELIENETTRRELAEAGGKVAAQLTYEARASEWSEAWNLRDRQALASWRRLSQDHTASSAVTW